MRIKKDQTRILSVPLLVTTKSRTLTLVEQQALTTPSLVTQTYFTDCQCLYTCLEGKQQHTSNRQYFAVVLGEIGSQLD